MKMNWMFAPEEKCTGAQIRMCFEALRNPNAPTLFD